MSFSCGVSGRVVKQVEQMVDAVLAEDQADRLSVKCRGWYSRWNRAGPGMSFFGIACWNGLAMSHYAEKVSNNFRLLIAR